MIRAAFWWIALGITCVVLPARADMGGRSTVLVPQLIVPFGSLSDIAGTGGGLGVEFYRPLDSELGIVTSISSLAFGPQTNVDHLLSIDGLIAVTTDRRVASRYDVFAVPVTVGLKYHTPDIFATLAIGDLFTRVEQTTALHTGATKRAAGFDSRNRHGLLLTATAGLSRGDVSFTGIRMAFSPRKRGPDGVSNFAWATLFISL